MLDNKPRDLNEKQQEALKTLANQTMRLIQLHKKTKELTHSRQVMQQVNTELENFAQVTVEKLRMPCDNAIEFTGLIEEKYADAMDVDGRQILALIKYSCENIKATVDDTLQRANRIGLLQDSKTLFTFDSLMQELKQRLSSLPVGIVPGNHPDDASVYYYKALLLQILSQIISASSLFSHNTEFRVEIAFQPDRQQYIFCIADNGKGVPVFMRNKEFALLHPSKDRIDEDTAYLRTLTAARQMITSLAGSLDMNFIENRSTVFTITVPK